MSKQALFAGVKCITLDLDDTLWPVAPTLLRAEHTLYDWMERHYPAVTKKYSVEEIAHKRMELSKQRADIAYNVTQLRYCALSELAEEFGFNASFADDALALFREYRNYVEPYQHSESVLSYLQQHYIVGAITNGNAQLHKTPLGQYFDFAVAAEHVGVSKPNDEIFKVAAEQAGVDRQQIIHIGDSPKTDVLGALNAGFKAIWFNQNRLPWPGGQSPDKVVHCLSELPPLLKQNN